jgi:hypothetical protein
VEWYCFAVSLTVFFCDNGEGGLKDYANVISEYRYSQVWFWYRTAFPYYNHWSFTYTRKGLIKLLISRGAKILALFLTILGVVKIRRKAKAEEMTVAEYLENMRDVVKMGAKMGAVMGINKTMKRLKEMRTNILS